MTGDPVLYLTETYERQFDSPPEHVFRAWVDPAVKRGWFAPTANAYELDATAGGVERLIADVDGAQMEFRAEYRDVVDCERLVWTSTLWSDGALSTAAVDCLTLSSDGAGGTLLTLVEQACFLPGMERPEWREAGIRDQLDKLAAALGGDNGTVG